MKSPIVAVTVSRHYFLQGEWSIKYLSIAHKKNGIPIFHVRSTMDTSIDKHSLEGIAILYAITHKIPFIPNILQGSPITDKQVDRLKKYGVAV